MMSDVSLRSPHQRPDFGKAWPWDRVVEQVDVELAPFVAELRRRGLDQVIYAALGIEGLYLCMSPTWPRDGDVLRLHASGGDIRLTYLASVSRERNCSDRYAFSRGYPTQEVWPAFKRFVVRAHWFTESHPMLAEGVS